MEAKSTSKSINFSKLFLISFPPKCIMFITMNKYEQSLLAVFTISQFPTLIVYFTYTSSRFDAFPYVENVFLLSPVNQQINACIVLFVQF